MKKFLFLFLCLLLPISLCSCSKENTPLTANTLDHRCYEEITKIEGVENLSDESIKALSIIVRTNIQNQPQENLETNNNEILLDETQKTRIKSLINYTSNLTLKNINNANNFDLSENNNIFNINYYLETNPNNQWKKEIKKYEILSFLDKQGISLANLSSLSFSGDDDGRVTELYVGGKTFPFKMFANQFHLESDKITNIKTSVSSIIIEGIGKGFVDEINLLTIESLSQDSKDYIDILSKLFPETIIVFDSLN